MHKEFIQSVKNTFVKQQLTNFMVLSYVTLTLTTHKIMLLFFRLCLRIFLKGSFFFLYHENSSHSLTLIFLQFLSFFFSLQFISFSYLVHTHFISFIRVSLVFISFVNKERIGYDVNRRILFIFLFFCKPDEQRRNRK